MALQNIRVAFDGGGPLSFDLFQQPSECMELSEYIFGIDDQPTAEQVMLLECFNGLCDEVRAAYRNKAASDTRPLPIFVHRFMDNKIVELKSLAKLKKRREEEAAAAAAAAAGEENVKQEKLISARAELERLIPLNLFQRLGLPETASAEEVRRVVNKELLKTKNKYEQYLAMWRPLGNVVYSRLMSAYTQCYAIIANENVTERATTPKLLKLAGRSYPVGTQYRQIYLDLLRRLGMADHDRLL
jgi:hypothetical protein